MGEQVPGKGNSDPKHRKIEEIDHISDADDKEETTSLSIWIVFICDSSLHILSNALYETPHLS